MKTISGVRVNSLPAVLLGAVCCLIFTGLAAAQEDAYLDPSEPLQQSSAGNVVQQARMAYDQGVRDLDKADKLILKAEKEASEAKAAKMLKKAEAARESAVQQFMQALQLEPEMIMAYEGLGQAFRSLGKHQEALEIQAIGLRRDPENLTIFQGWAESLLALNMLGNATQSYTSYVEAGSPRAEILMGEMKKWLEARQVDPGDVDPEHVKRMAEWMAQQGQGG